jgi:hypothetical protein
MMRLRSWEARLCDHLRHEVRQRIDAAGCPFYQRQCLDCGARLGTAVAAAKALADGRQPPPFDEDLYEYGAENSPAISMSSAPRSTAPSTNGGPGSDWHMTPISCQRPGETSAQRR